MSYMKEAGIGAALVAAGLSTGTVLRPAAPGTDYSPLERATMSHDVVTGHDRLVLRITGQGSEVLDICNAQGHCPTAHERQTWTITAAPAGVLTEGELQVQGWAARDDRDDGSVCSVNGSYSGRFQLTHLAWWTPTQAYAHGIEELEPGAWRGPGRVLVVGITSLPDANPAAASTSGSCPPEVSGDRVYDTLAESLVEMRFFRVFVPGQGAGSFRSVAQSLDGIIRGFSLEVLDGDVNQIEKYVRRVNDES